MDWKFFFEVVGLFLTLMVLLYLIIGDNALFRIVTYAFIGVASGYVAVLVIFQVLVPRLLNLLTSGDLLSLGLRLIPFVLGVLLLFKLFPRLTAVGTLPMAVLVGVGAAVAVGGALFGTLFGQIRGTIGLFSTREGLDATRLLEGVFVLIGAASTLAYFQFSTRSRMQTSGDVETVTAGRALALEIVAKIGKVFIGITLGAVFAGVFTAAITALIERIGFVINVILSFF